MEPSPPSRTCPQCGQPLPVGAEACAKCGRDEANPFTSPAAPAREPQPATFGWKFYLALAAVVGGCTAIGFAVPGLGVILGMVLMPATVRAAIVVKRRREATGAGCTPEQIASAVFASAGISIAVWMASAVAFAAVCTPVGLVAFSIDSKSIVSAVFAFGLGGLAGLAVFFWGMNRLWPRAKEDD